MKNKLFLVISLVFGILLAAPSSFAGQIESTTVQSIQIHSSKVGPPAIGLVLYSFADLPTDSPACAADPEGRMIFVHGINFRSYKYDNQYYDFDGGDERVYNALELAYLNDSLLDVIGTGDCYLGFEVVQVIILKK